jgi:MFS family permease
VRFGILGLLMAFSFMNHFNRMSMAVAGDERIMNDFHISPTRMGFVYSAFLLAYTLFMVPGGWLLDRIGPRRALLGVGFGTATFAAATGVVGWLGWQTALLFTGLMIVRGVMGAFAAPIYPATGSVVRRWMPRHRRAASNGWIMAAALVAIACVYRVFGALMDLVGWPAAFVVIGGVTAAIAVLWSLIATDRPEQHALANQAERALIAEGDAPEPATAAGSAISTLLRNRSLVLLTASYAAVGYFEYLFFYWMHHYFEHELHLGKDASAWYAGIPSLAMAVGMPLGGWLSDRLMTRLGPRLGRAIVPAGGMLASALLLMLGVLSHEPVWIVAWFSLAMAAVGATEGPFWTAAVALGGRRGGTSGAIVNTGGNAGGMIAPVLTPWVGELAGWPWAISLGSLFCLLGAGAWFWIDAERGSSS